jgi:myo-inositol 2-dehydrogenase / D-chiro-inositol 1-dehydrogenase
MTLAALKVVRQSKKVFQYGGDRRSTPDARKGIELALNGRIGKVRKIYVVTPPSLSGGSPGLVIPAPKGFEYDMWLGPAATASLRSTTTRPAISPTGLPIPSK